MAGMAESWDCFYDSVAIAFFFLTDLLDGLGGRTLYRAGFPVFALLWTVGRDVITYLTIAVGCWWPVA